MAQKIATDIFRSKFKHIDKEALHWFPGHMNKGLKQMQHKLRSVDCVIEVHDARIPFSGRNSNFKYTVSGLKPHILVLNKCDLIEENLKDKLLDKLQKDDNEHVVFTNSKDRACKGIKEIVPLVNKLIRNSDRYNRSDDTDYCVMIIGIPNVGKSSLTNVLRNRHLRRGNASAVGAVAGITRSVLTKIKISQSPLIYMLDTPGILTPVVPSVETGLKLALCATIQDHLVGETIIADYLLYWLNKYEQFSYVNHFMLEKAHDNILEVLTAIALKNNRSLKFRDVNGMYVQRPDLEMAAKIFVKSFRNGDLGNMMLDLDCL